MSLASRSEVSSFFRDKIRGKQNRGPEVGTGICSSAINRLARSARALASFASYADQLLSNTEIVSRGPERPSGHGKTET